MNQQQLKDRTKDFAIRIIRVFKSLPKTYDAKVIGGQLLRSGTSVAANYRAACRARTKKEFTSKLHVVLEEADESQFWLELLQDCGYIKPQKLSAILEESGELVAIFTTSLITVQQRNDRKTLHHG